MKSFIRTSLLSAAIILVTTVIMFSTEFWAPGIFKMIESIGDYQYKPWVFFAPGFIVILMMIMTNPAYKNKKSIIALLIGGTVLMVFAVLALMILAYFAMPTMRY